MNTNTLSPENKSILTAGGNLPGATPPDGHDPFSKDRLRFLIEQQAKQFTGEVAVGSLVTVKAED
ncbi:MAG: hypothetical protein ACM3MA_01975 [Acidobacteriota bacterium]|jgi:hypothetical protein